MPDSLCSNRRQREVHALRMADGAFESSAGTLQGMIHLLIVDATAENFHVQFEIGSGAARQQGSLGDTQERELSRHPTAP